jgi:hypothetical protein
MMIPHISNGLSQVCYLLFVISMLVWNCLFAHRDEENEGNNIIR